MGREVEWVNRFLDREYVRRLAETTLRSYAMDLLHFLRWWASVNHTDADHTKAPSVPRFCWTTCDSKPASIPNPRPLPSTVASASLSARCATSSQMQSAPSRQGFTICIGGVRRWVTAVLVQR